MEEDEQGEGVATSSPQFTITFDKGEEYQVSPKHIAHSSVIEELIENGTSAIHVKKNPAMTSSIAKATFGILDDEESVEAIHYNELSLCLILSLHFKLERVSLLLRKAIVKPVKGINPSVLRSYMKVEGVNS
jgi:hypothetical protein